MVTISQRELRNDNARIVRGVEAGETYVVTRRGVPVARLVPVREDGRPVPARPASRRPSYADVVRVRAAVSSAEVLDDLRGDR